MNIFALSDSPHESAIWQHDRHVVKMILESAQMLSTLGHGNESFRAAIPPQYLDRLYKSTHVNHPCNIWLRQSESNAIWLTLHLDSLVAEYHRRFQKVHATNELRMAFNEAVCNIAGVARMWGRDDDRNLRLNNTLIDMAAQHTPFAVCMPDEMKLDPSRYRNAEVQSYQRLYIHSKIWQSHVKWTRCESIPAFILKARDGMPTASVTRAHITALEDAHARAGTVPKPDLSRPAVPYTPKPNPKAITRFGTSAK